MASETNEPRLLVDSTAARLSKWLRFLGVDVVLDESRSTARVLLRARREERLLLTRRRKLEGASPKETLLLESDHVCEQLKQVIAALGLSIDLLPRCTVCNGQLRVVSRVSADGRVPEFVYRTQTEFAYCDNCDRYYWKGTHWKNVCDVSKSLRTGPPRSGKAKKNPV